MLFFQFIFYLFQQTKLEQAEIIYFGNKRLLFGVLKVSGWHRIRWGDDKIFLVFDWWSLFCNALGSCYFPDILTLKLLSLGNELLSVYCCLAWSLSRDLFLFCFFF